MKKSNCAFKDEVALFTEHCSYQHFIVKSYLSDFLVRIRRKKKGLTQKKVAKSIGVSERKFRKMEINAMVPMDTMLRAYYYYLEIGCINPVERRLFVYVFRLFWRF